MYEKDKMTTVPHHILFGCSEMPGHCRHDGLSVTAAFSEQSIAGAKKFEFNHDDILVAAYPRSGGTLVQEIVYQLHNKSGLLHENITERVPCLEYHGRASCIAPTGIRKAQYLPQPRIMKTHLPARFLHKAFENGTKVIYLMRNPKDLCTSYYEYYKGSRRWGNWSFSTFQHLFFNTDKLCFGNVFDHCLSFWQERARANILIVFYEDLIRNKSREITKIAKFLGTTVESSHMQQLVEMTSFEAMKNNKNMDPLIYERITAQVRIDYEFYARGNSGYWREYFTETQNLQYDNVIRARMTSEGIYFNYGLEKAKQNEDGKSSLSLCGRCGAQLDEQCKNENLYNSPCFFKNMDF